MAFQTPKVSVVVLAYHHEKFLRQALAGVLGQEVDFPSEVIVGEDCSTDRTRHIVQEYEQRYPAIVKPIYHARNVGMGANFKACMEACRGQYIALLEGDDYWTSPLKLHKQVRWMDQNPDFTLCFHPVADLYEDGFHPKGEPIERQQEVYTFDDFLTPIYTIVSTGSMLLRNVLPTWPAWLFSVKPIDFALVLLYAELGKAKRLPEVMGVYRIHQGGIWSGAPRHLNIKSFLLMYEQLWRHYAPTSRAAALRRHLYDLYLTTANVYANSGYTAEASGFFKKAIRLGPSFSNDGLKNLLGASFRLARSITRRTAQPAKAAP
jgi:glycosyltransferase involved in cell wall biosynthesis